MEFIINKFLAVDIKNSLLIYNKKIGVNLKSPEINYIIKKIQNHKSGVIQDQDLKVIASKSSVNYEALIDFLVNKIYILYPRTERMFKNVILDIEDELIYNILYNTYSSEFSVKSSSEYSYTDEETSLTIFYRNSYLSKDYSEIYNRIKKNDYIITSGTLASNLIIDNIYFANSGLPTHFSGVNNCLAAIDNELSITKNNWLLFYRELMKNDLDEFPVIDPDSSQKAYISYCLRQFANQYTSFWTYPTTLDMVNWYWNVDLNSMEITKEVALHSPFSEQDMNLEEDLVFKQA